LVDELALEVNIKREAQIIPKPTHYSTIQAQAMAFKAQFILVHGYTLGSRV
jgi:hypothetical protein